LKSFQGKAGSAPTSEELSSALKNHDLFIYFGHGSGMHVKYATSCFLLCINKIVTLQWC